MSDAIRAMLAERRAAEKAGAAGLIHELNRRIVEARKAKFVAAFNRQARYYRAKRGTIAVPKLPLDAVAEAEGCELAVDPGWDAERAWRYSATRALAIEELEAEIERRAER